MAAPDDAATVAALAVQVFLDTYATEGVRPDLAAEVFAEYSAEAFVHRLRQPGRRFILAEQSAGLVGFAEVRLDPSSAPAGDAVGAELVRLFIQPRFQHQGIGRRLLRQAEQAAMAAALGGVWLTVWEGNHRARDFYAAQGYGDVGATGYSFRGHTYGDRVLVKPLRRRAGTAQPVAAADARR